MLKRRLPWTVFERILGTLTLALFVFCAWVRLDADFYQRVQGWRLEEILHRAIGGTARWSGARKARGAVATRAEASRSGLIGRLEIPRLGVEAIVAEGTDSKTLRRAVGHVPTTSLPGEAGNVALAGHRDSFFRPLKSVRVGDRLRMTTPDGVFDYRVESKRVVGPEETTVLSSSRTPTLTLITCYPFEYVGMAPERFVVRARQVDDTR
jgi:sortase A